MLSRIIQLFGISLQYQCVSPVICKTKILTLYYYYWYFKSLQQQEFCRPVAEDQLARPRNVTRHHPGELGNT